MRKKNAEIERYRLHLGAWGSSRSDGNNGVFIVPYGNEFGDLRVIISDGMGWDHASVSTETRCPTWEEMSYIKNLFFEDEETVMQLHPPKSQYINQHEYCLHLWSKHGYEIPLPPREFVGVA